MPHSDREVRPCILIVDDEPTNLQVLRQILQDDYRLLFARDGHKALELAGTEKPQLILLDVMMPGLTGHDTCKTLKQNPATAHIPVIFVTALSDVDDETHGFELGAV
ncbi:MAG: response regulator, partial [Aquabacterium sp.]|uniref:response regulator n=1 Tax=Aquabacterium sp. TaxID=1872578 RepID=UPI001221A3E1